MPNMQPLMGGADRARQARQKNFNEQRSAIRANANKALLAAGDKLPGGSATPAMFKQSNIRVAARQKALAKRFSGYSKIQ